MHALSSNPAIKETSMKRKILWAFLIIWLILTAYLLFLSNKWASAATPSYAASSAVTTDNFAELLRETLQKNPDLLLSVLRENSEAVLEMCIRDSPISATRRSGSACPSRCPRSSASPRPPLRWCCSFLAASVCPSLRTKRVARKSMWGGEGEPFWLSLIHL